MKRIHRPAASFAFMTTYLAFWFAFVTTGDTMARSIGFPRWALSLAASLLLMALLFLAGSVIASSPPSWGRAGQQPVRASTVIVALVVVGALLGLMATLRIVLWGGPPLVRWILVGLAVGALVIGSGRAWPWAVLGGLLCSLLGIWGGAGQPLVHRIDHVLTTLMVGATVGAVAGHIIGPEIRAAASDH